MKSMSPVSSCSKEAVRVQQTKQQGHQTWRLGQWKSDFPHISCPTEGDMVMSSVGAGVLLPGCLSGEVGGRNSCRDPNLKGLQLEGDQSWQNMFLYE